MSSRGGEAARAAAARHITEHALGEAARIARVSRTQVLAVGSLSAGIGSAIGHVVTAVVG